MSIKDYALKLMKILNYKTKLNDEVSRTVHTKNIKRIFSIIIWLEI